MSAEVRFKVIKIQAIIWHIKFFINQ